MPWLLRDYNLNLYTLSTQPTNSSQALEYREIWEGVSPSKPEQTNTKDLQLAFNALETSRDSSGEMVFEHLN